MIKTDSSLISEYAYDENSWVLTIQFRGTGELRHYANVSPDVADDFHEAKSKGQYFNAHIARKYSVQREEVAQPVVAVLDRAADDDFEALMDADIAAVEAEWARNPAPKAEPHPSEMAIWPSQPIPESIARDVHELGKAKTVSEMSLHGLAENAEEYMAATAPTYGGIERGLFPDPTTPVIKKMRGFDSQIENDRPAEPTPPKPDPIAEILPPEAALPKKNEAQIAAYTEEARLLAAKPIIVTADTYQTVYDHVADMTAKRKRVFEFFDPVRDAMYKAYTLLQGRQKAALDPLDNAIKAGKQALLAYDQEQARKAAEAQRIADAAAEAAAEAERKRLSEELTLAEVSDALAAGDVERAEAFIAAPIEAPPMQVYAPRVTEYQAPAVAGKSTRKNWKGEVTNLEELVLDVAKGIEHFRAKGNLGGHAPLSFLLGNTTAINQQAKAQESMFRFPGVRAFNDAVMSVRAK